MNVGDLVRNIHTVRGGEADERGIVVEAQRSQGDDPMSDYDYLVRVVWFSGDSDYETWMDTDDLEIIGK